MQLNFNSFASMISALPNDQACRDYLEATRWGGTPVCPHCGTIDANHYKLKVSGVFKGMYKCRACKERFTVTVGTIFEGSHISLHKWFIATYIFSSHKKGISSHQLARDLGVTQKTAWFMLHRLREVFDVDKANEKIGGGGQAVEVDETYVGGKLKNMCLSKRKAHKDGRLDHNSNKTVVMGYAVRGGKLSFQVVTDKKAVKQMVVEKVSNEAVLITDASHLYTPISKNFAAHEVVNHSEDEYVRGIVHTNTIEGAFSMFDRMVIGIYHYISPKHMQKYANELAFRYNSRKDGDKTRFDFALRSTQGIKVKYASLIAK